MFNYVIFPGARDADRESITIIGKILFIYESCFIVELVGTKEAVEARVKELDNIVEDSMTVDPKNHRHFDGEVLRIIGDKIGGVVVSFPRNGVAGDKINLKGARNCIDAVKDLEIEQIYYRYNWDQFLWDISNLSTNLQDCNGRQRLQSSEDHNRLQCPDKVP